MIGEIGALGGGILPNLLGQSKQHTGSYALGFLAYAIFSLIVLVTIRVVSRRWIGTWVAAGGRAILSGISHGRLRLEPSRRLAALAGDIADGEVRISARDPGFAALTC